MLHGMDKSKTQTHDFKGLDDFFPAFVGGEQVDSNGTKKVWSGEELDQIVTNTKKLIDNNIFSGAPMVIGHPKTDAPAYGWIQDLKREGNVLSVKGDKLHDEFAEGVEKGLWPNRSIRIGKGADGFYLKHVGFLGAVPPAIEGMDSIYNANTDDECFDYAYQDSITPNILSRMMRRFREFIINKYDVETADSVIPDYEIENLSEHAKDLRDEGIKSTPSYSKPKPTKTGDEPMSAFTKEQLDAAVEKAVTKAKEEGNAEFTQKEEAHKTALTAERNKRLVVEFNKNISALVDDGKLLPAQAEGMSEFMLQLSDADEANFEFSAGKDGKGTIKKSPLDWFNDFTKALGKQIDFKESGAGESSGVDGDDAQAIANAAVEFQKEQADKGITISVSQAVAHINKQNK